MTKNIRNLALATMSGFRHKTVDVPEWEGATVVLREPSAEAWLRWQEIVKAKDDETPLSVAERARRNLEADVELFIDVLCDTGLQPVFSEDDREQVIAVYGPVHARLLRQSLELISDAGEVKSSASGDAFSDDAGAQDGAHIVRVTPGNVRIRNHDVGRI